MFQFHQPYTYREKAWDNNEVKYFSKYLNILLTRIKCIQIIDKISIKYHTSKRKWLFFSKMHLEHLNFLLCRLALASLNSSLSQVVGWQKNLTFSRRVFGPRFIRPFWHILRFRTCCYIISGYSASCQK